MAKNKKQKARAITQAQKQQRDTKHASPVQAPLVASPSAVKAPKPEKSAFGFAPLVLTVAEVCHLLNISRTTLYRLEKSQPLPGRVKIGGQIRYSRTAIEKWLDEEMKRHETESGSP